MVDILFAYLFILLIGIALVMSVRGLLRMSVKRTAADYGRGGWRLWVVLASFIVLGWIIIRPVIETANSSR